MLRRVLTRFAAFIGAILVIALLLALQVGIPGGAFVASIYLAVLFSPLVLIDALLVPAPRTGPARLARVMFLFVLLLAVSAAMQWRALAAVPFDLQVQIATEALLRDIAFLGAYLLLEVVLGHIVHRSVAA